MKKVILTLLCLLLLTGCGSEPPPATEPTVPPTEPTEATAAPTEPASLYDGHSEIEQLSGGAVKLYPLNLTGATGIVPFGEDLLLFAGNDLFRLDADRVYIKAHTCLDLPILPTDPAVQVSQKGVTYHDSLTNDLVFLDGSLKEVSRMALPEALTGNPALSSDRKNLYYFTADGLRTLNMESGIDRLVTQMSFPAQSITALHCSDTIVQCRINDETGVCASLFLDVKTGALICRADGDLHLTTLKDRYFTEITDGTYREKLTGTADSEVMMLNCPGLQTNAYPVLECGGILTLTPDTESRIVSFYDLSDGSRPYSITMPLQFSPRELTGDPVRDCIWLLGYSPEHDCDALYRWDYASSSIADDTAYLGQRRTADYPDTVGLEACAALAEEISRKHHVTVLTWLDALDSVPVEYTLEPEYQVEVLTDALNRLDTALSHYPEGFFGKAVSEMGDGELRIGLVRSISGNSKQGTPDLNNGIQYWDDSMNTYLQLPIGGNLENALHHELFHVIESRIFSSSLALDDWEKLNPKGFEYSYNYLEYESRQQDILCDDGTPAFADAYGTTFPKEDRATVFACGMMPGNEELFTSPILQAKLRAVCKGIREAYDLKKTDAVLLWEQYLEKPLKYK